jgi:hypothetical protein
MPKHDIEKSTAPTEGIQEFPAGNLSDSDQASTDFQDGIQRVRAITSTWSKTTLCTMFILYVCRLFLTRAHNLPRND